MVNRVLSAVAVVAIGFGVLIGAATNAHATQETTPGECLVSEEVSHTEYKYKKWVPGEEGHTEYRWQAEFKKGKELKGWYVTGVNDWHEGDPGTWYELPESKQPERFDGIAPTGTVPLSVYGGPGGISAPYQYGVSYTVYYPGPGADDWTTDATPPVAPSGSSWGTAKTRTVGATEGDWEYSGWVTEELDEPWEFIKDRKVVDQEAVYGPCQPDPEVRGMSSTDVDCEAGTVTITTTEETAGYYLGEDNNWHLGEFVVTSETTETRSATFEECPVSDMEPVELVEPEVLQLAATGSAGVPWLAVFVTLLVLVLGAVLLYIYDND